MALTLERPADRNSDTSTYIDHILYVLINRWREVKEIADEIDSMDSYETMDFIFEWKKTNALWIELNELLDGGEMKSDQIVIYHALQQIIIDNMKYLDLINSRFSVSLLLAEYH